MEQLKQSIDPKNRLKSLTSLLFNEQQSNKQLILVFSALITAANDRPKLARELSDWVNNFINTIAEQIELEFVNQLKSKINAVATGIVGIYFNVDSLHTLGNINNIRKNSKLAVSILIDSLRE